MSESGSEYLWKRLKCDLLSIIKFYEFYSKNYVTLLCRKVVLSNLAKKGMCHKVTLNHNISKDFFILK